MRILWLIGAIFLTSCQVTPVSDSNEKTLQKKVQSPTGTYEVKKTAPRSRFFPTERDGPPPGPLPTRFKKVIPVYAPLSRYGNPDVYRVNGHTYEVLTSSSGYRTRGLASWYGTRFHSKRTSSGEDYDMYALTAAHKTLPIPCYVRVKNLENGKVAIVRVNDRGPFHDGRVIDLSYAAGAKLGLFPKGTARVEIEALTVKDSKGAHVAHFYLQAGAFASGQLAMALQQKLAKLSPSPVFIEKNQQRYLVRVGPFANREMAESLKKTLARHGVTGSFSMLI